SRRPLPVRLRRNGEPTVPIPPPFAVSEALLVERFPLAACSRLPPAVTVVLPLGLRISPPTRTGAFDVMLTVPVGLPEKSIEMRLSAFTDCVMRRRAPV